TRDVGEARVQVAGQAVARVPVQEDLVELREEPLAEPLAQPEQTLRLVRHALAAEVARLSEADDARHVERPGAEAALVAAAVDDGRQPHARGLRTHVE